jgi:hypothetical protein
MKLFKIDPTSSLKLSKVLKIHFLYIIIALNSKNDSTETIKNIRSYKDFTQITLLDQWDIEVDDKNLYKIHVNDILANRLLDNLPNIPVTASNVGLGIGEIMEMRIPFNSSYAHKNINSIKQKDWKIVGIYRNDKLMMVQSQTIIEPDDRILTVGDPKVLSQIFKTVNQTLNDFPMPFGKNIYSLIDLKYLSISDVDNILDELISIKEKLTNSKIIVRVMNISTIEAINHIDAFCIRNGLILKYDFQSLSLHSTLIDDNERFNIGLILLSNKEFKQTAIRKEVVKLNLPILRVGDSKIKDIKNINILIQKNSYYEQIAPTIFNIASKFGLKIELLSVKTDDEDYNDIIAYYNTLSQILSKKITTSEFESSNPITTIKKYKDYVQPIPLTNENCNTNFLSLISKNSDAISSYYLNNTQLFIPINRV